MKIALIGGLIRREAELAVIAQRAGHELEWHSGEVGGRGARSIKAAVERADLVVIVTEINSHGSMYLAKKLAHKLGRQAVVVRSCGPSKFETLLAEWHGSDARPVRSLPRCA
jgi:hypothetical protein